MNKIIDARGLACPQPVILTKKAMDTDPEKLLTTIVDNSAAKENVSKLAVSQGYSIQIETKNGEHYITLSR